MGVVLLLLGFFSLAFGLINLFKGKRILAAPFKKTGELAKDPTSIDPKGAMSTEGKVIPPAERLLSPCSKQPCLAYEVKIERLYEKSETTQDGTKTVKGSETLDTLKGGSVFGLDDGSGIFHIDVSKGADFDNMKEGYKKEVNGRSGASHITFGEYTYDVPAIGSGNGWTIGFKATEKFVPVEGSLFVLGKLEGASLVKPSWRSMMISAKGRQGLLGSVRKRMKGGFIGAGALAVLSIPAFILAPAGSADGPSAFCESNLMDARELCSASVTSTEGVIYTWTVTEPGEYELTVAAQKRKISLMPQLIVTNEEGEELVNEVGDSGESLTATAELKAGTYELKVLPGDGNMVKGGFSFDLEIRSLSAKAKVAEGEAPYSQAQLEAVVDGLNEVCPDTFCEGQYAYDFKKLTCADARHCTLSFVARDQDRAKAKALEAEVDVGGFVTLLPDSKKPFVYEGSFDEKVGLALAKWEKNPQAKKAAPPPAKPASKPPPSTSSSKVPENQPQKARTVATAPPPAPAPEPAAAPAPSPAPSSRSAVPKKDSPAPSIVRTSKNLED